MDLTFGEKLHDAIIKDFILAQKGKMSIEWTIVPGELVSHYLLDVNIDIFNLRKCSNSKN